MSSNKLLIIFLVLFYINSHAAMDDNSDELIIATQKSTLKADIMQKEAQAQMQASIESAQKIKSEAILEAANIKQRAYAEAQAIKLQVTGETNIIRKRNMESQQRAADLMQTAIINSKKMINIAEQTALEKDQKINSAKDIITNIQRQLKSTEDELQKIHSDQRIIEQYIKELKNKIIDAESILLGVPHKIHNFFESIKSVFTGKNGRVDQAVAIGATVVAAAVLTYAIGKSQGAFLTNEEKLADLQKKLLEIEIALEVTIKTKEKSSDKAEIKILNIKIITLKAKVTAIKNNIEKLKTKIKK